MKRERGGSQKSFWSAPACGLIGNGIQKQRDKQQQLQQRKPLQMSKHKCDQSTTLHRSPQVLNGLGETLSGSQSTPTNRCRLANGTQVHFLALTGEAKDCGKSWERSHNVTPELRVCSFTALESIEFTMSPCLRYFSKNSWEETNIFHIQWELSYKINVVTRARTSLDPCWILFSLPTEQTGLWMTLSIWDCITSCNTSTNLGITQGSYLWTSALPSISSCLTFSQTNRHSSVCPPTSVSGSQIAST